VNVPRGTPVANPPLANPPDYRRPPRNTAVDAIKGVAIICVILVHTLPAQLLARHYRLYWIAQAVPVFIVLMGYVGATSRVNPLKDYAWRRLLRLGPPLALTWLVSYGIYLARGGTGLGTDVFLGALPATGPGNYFIPVLVQFAIVLPLLRPVYRRSPLLLLIGAAVVNVAFEIVAKRYGLSDLAYTNCVLRYLFGICLGMWMAADGRVWPLLFISVPYLWLQSRGSRIFLFYDHWQSQSLFAFGYTAAIVGLGLRVGGGSPRWLTHLGRASLHIFLVQILWFGQFVLFSKAMRELPLAVVCLVNVSVCVTLGILFYSAESAVTKRLSLASSSDRLSAK